MKRNHILTEEYGRRIQQGLAAAGMKSLDIANTMNYLDTMIYDSVVEDLYENLDDDKQVEFDILVGKNPQAEEILAFLGSDEQDFKIRYLYKLEDYLANLGNNFSDLKAKILTAQAA